MSSCESEIQRYNAYVYSSLALTLVLYFSVERFRHNLEKAWKFSFAFGVIKIVIGILLLTVFLPVDCDTFISGYGYVAIIIGLVWLKRARNYYRVSRMQTVSQNQCAIEIPVPVDDSVGEIGMQKQTSSMKEIV